MDGISRRVFMGAAAGAAALPGLAWSQGFPSKAMRIVVPFAPGGTNDIIGRLVSRILSEDLGQPVIVENRPGASGTLGAAFVAKAPADGYTLLISSTGPIVMAPSLYKSLPYHPQRDLTPVGQVTANPMMLALHPSVPARNLTELIALAKASPGKLSYASTGAGTAPHLATEQLASAAGIELLHVPYKGGSPAVTDLLAGRVDMMFDAVSTFLPYVTTDKLRALAVGGQVRSPALPQVPTIAESGLAGVNVAFWVGLFAPAGTPPEILRRLNASVSKGLMTPSVKDVIAAQGGIPTPGPSDQFMRAVDQETQRWGEVIRRLGVTAD